MKIKTKYLVFLLFAITLAFRLYMAFSVDNFSTETSYYNLRHINYLVEERSIIYYDELSYGGRYILQPPLFFVIMALLTFGNEFLLKIIPEIFLSFLVVIVYLMAKEISENEYSALFAALISSFIPIFLEKTINNISVYSLALPLLFFMLYSLLKIEEKFYRNCFIACSFLLPLIHPIAVIFIVTIGFYFLILSGGAIHTTKLKREAILFSVLAIIFIELWIYKKALFTYNLNIIWQNIPVNILEDTYKEFMVKDLVLGVGIIPLILGSIGVYIGMNEKRKAIYLYAAFVLTILLLLVLRLVTISIGLMILGIAMSIFSALTIVKFVNYFKKTRFHGLNYFFVLILIFSFIFLSFIPSFGNNLNEISDEKLNDMKWIQEHTTSDEVIVGNLLEGHLITSVAERKNIMDINFLLAPNPIKRMKEVDLIYSSFTEARVLELIKKYNIKIIYLSEDTEKLYGIKDLNFVKGSNCFDWEAKFYVFKC